MDCIFRLLFVRTWYHLKQYLTIFLWNLEIVSSISSRTSAQITQILQVYRYHTPKLRSYITRNSQINVVSISEENIYVLCTQRRHTQWRTVIRRHDVTLSMAYR